MTRTSSSARLLPVRLLAIAGLADTTLFLATRIPSLKDNPQRLFGTIGVGALWAGLFASTLADRNAPGARTTALYGTLTAVEGALLAAHLSHSVASTRTFVGPAIACAGLGLSAAGVRQSR